MDDSAVRSGSPEELTKTPPTERTPADDDATRAPDDTATQPSVDAQHPWLGLASFTEETRAYFYGREDEVAELVRRVQRKTLTLLFGQSGLGKTSILRAGIVPWLRPTGYSPVYVRIDYSRESPSPAEQIKAAIFRATLESGQWTQTGVAVAGESLWEFLHHRDDILRDASGKTLIPLLIFDQFEEIFTLAQTDDFGRKRAAEFIEDLADLVENRAPKALEARIEQDESAAERFDFTRSDYRILIALREDYLAHLEALKEVMPSITQNRMRLARMTGEQALSAVVKPGGKLVSLEVAESIVRFIAGGSELRNAEVEPSLLSLICRELNNARIAKGRAEISVDLLAGSHDTILADFYERALADQPEAVRRYIEDELLTDSGFRESIAEERIRKAFAAAGARPDALAALVDRRLLRIEERLDVRRVELTHDVLCSVVRASRDLRHEREARDEAERKLDEQRTRQRATRKALVRARQIAAVCAVLAIGAAGSAIFGYVNMKRAQQAEAQALETRAMAETARGESEKLVVYLLDDFYLELAPVGRLDIIGELAKRALDYYNGLPDALRTPQTERNRALALVRYGLVLRQQAKLAEGRKVIDEAIAVLSRMRDQGDASEATAIGLALGLSTQARLASSVDDQAGALAVSTKAVDAIKPLATAPNASIPLRRAYGEVLNMHGFLQLRNRLEAAIATLEETRAVDRSIANLDPSDLAAAAGYAEASAWLVQTFIIFGRGEDAKSAGKEGLAVAGKVLEKRPGHMQALRAQALATSPLSGLLADEMHLAEALAMADATQRAWREFVRLDPGNSISWSNLGVAHFIKGNILEAMGRIDDAAVTWRAMQAFAAQAPPSQLMKDGLALHAYRLAVLEAQRGKRRETDEALALGASHSKWVIDNAPAGSWFKLSRPVYERVWPVAAAEGLGDHDRALELGRAVAPDLDGLKPDQTSTREIHAFVLLLLHNAMASAAYAKGDFAAADREMGKVLEARKQRNLSELGERRDGIAEQTFAALVKVRLDRPDEARALIVPALAFQRDLARRNVDDPSQRAALAAALYVTAIAGVGDRAAQLAEAAALMDKLPPEMKRLSVYATGRDRIAEARAGRQT